MAFVAKESKSLVALTGATGFIGRHLLRELPKRGYRLRILLRRPSEVPLEAASAVIGDLVRPQNMAEALAGVDAVIHSAGLTSAASGIPEDDYRTLNTDATIALARAARRAGARRFVFLSSIRAQCGPVSDGVLTEQAPARPIDAYGRSKLAAEQGLAELDLDWVALRLVLVYGPGVKGNMARLMRLARSHLPVPFAGLQARRSLLSLDNLVTAIDTVLSVPQPLRRPLLVADAETLTAAEMIAAMRQGLGRRQNLFAVPGVLLRSACRASGRMQDYDRLARPLVVSPAGLRHLGWVPTVDTRVGLAAAMRE